MAKILIIDDDQVNTQIYANKLQAENHSVVIASDGKVALEKIKDQYDLIILDLMMPQIGGVDVLKAIKQGVNKNSIVIILTNLISDQMKQECLKNGANEYLLKVDYSPLNLLEKLGDYLK